MRGSDKVMTHWLITYTFLSFGHTSLSVFLLERRALSIKQLLVLVHEWLIIIFSFLIIVQIRNRLHEDSLVEDNGDESASEREEDVLRVVEAATKDTHGRRNGRVQERILVSHVVATSEDNGG